MTDHDAGIPETEDSESIDEPDEEHDAATDTSSTRSTTPPRKTLRQRLESVDRVELLIVSLIGIMLVVFVWGVSLGVTGEDRYRLPTAVESVVPVPDAVQVSPGSELIVDLGTGRTGVLTIDGIEIETVNIDELRTAPGQQIELPPVTIFEPGNSTLTFRPQAGSAVEQWTPGEHTVKITYWKVAEGEGRSSEFVWKFRVT